MTVLCGCLFFSEFSFYRFWLMLDAKQGGGLAWDELEASALQEGQVGPTPTSYRNMWRSMDPARVRRKPTVRGKKPFEKAHWHVWNRHVCTIRFKPCVILERTKTKEIVKGSGVARGCKEGEMGIGRAWRCLGEWYCWMWHYDEEAGFRPWPGSRECATWRERQYNLPSGVTDTMVLICLT